MKGNDFFRGDKCVAITPSDSIDNVCSQFPDWSSSVNYTAGNRVFLRSLGIHWESLGANVSTNPTSIKTVAIAAGGTGYAVNDVLAIAGGTSGTATVSAIDAPTSIATAVIAAAGTGYAVNDVLAIAGGTGGTATVTTIGALGIVTAVSLTTAGSGYTAGVIATTGGGGTGATITITITAASGIVTAVTLTAAGSAYVAAEVKATTGGGGTGATITITTSEGSEWRRVPNVSIIPSIIFCNGATGTIKVTCADGSVASFAASGIPAGGFLLLGNLRVVRVWSTGTTATTLFALAE